LARLAGFEPAGVIVEILNDDGTMARRSDLETFAQTHNLKLGTIADLIEYRSLNERSIEKVADCQWPSRYGEFQLHAYQDTIDGLVHYGLSMGNITHDDPTLVRVHVADTLTDLLGGQREGKLSWQLDHALRRIAKEGHGVVLVVTKKECPRDIIERLTRMEGIDKGNIPARKQHNQAVRTIGIGSQILADIGVGKMRLLSAPKRYNALSGFKLEVIEYIEE
jgi:3,4-dihydroxy 2-butanone 4-phosphate synthase/GTP cyclohydrolase II